MTFAGKIWRLLVGIKDALALLFLILFFGVIYAALTARPMAAQVEKGALLLDLDGVIVEERSAVDPLDVLLAGEAPIREYPARDVARALRLAAKDDRIKAVVLDLSGFMGGGLVHMREIGAAMDDVRQAGKPVLTFANVYIDDRIQLAAHASEAWLDPMGEALVAGPGGRMQYLKGLIDRFGVTAHVYRAGTFKSYVEPYLRADMSDEAREAYQDVYGALWDAWKADVRKARPKARLDRLAGDPVAAMKAAGGDFAKAAKDAGLIDRIGDRTEFGQRVAQLVGEDDGDPGYAHTRLATWLAANREKTPGKAIAVVTVAGEIVDGDAGPGQAGGDRIAELLDDNIGEDYQALVVRVDSPGGSVAASERIRRAIQRWRDAGIPVVVSMGNMAASGGYWVSTPAQRIFADPATITGSIGVFAMIPSFENALSKLGVTSDGVRTTPLSGQPDILGGFTPETDTLLQAGVDNIYGRFISLVAASRGRTAEQIDAVAQGRVWPGAKARELGLVDEAGGLDAALAHAARLAKIGNGQWHAAYLKGDEDPFARLLEQMRAGPQDDAVAGDFAALLAQRQRLQAARLFARIEGLVGSGGVQAYCLECPVMPTRQDRDAELSLLRLLGAR